MTHSEKCTCCGEVFPVAQITGDDDAYCLPCWHKQGDCHPAGRDYEQTLKRLRKDQEA